MVFCLKLVQYPNEEIRVTPYRPVVKPFSYDETDETHSEISTCVPYGMYLAPEESDRSLLDIGSKVATGKRTGLGSGKPGWGGLPKSKPFSRYGRRTLLRVGGVFNQPGFSTDKTIFLTGTLPGSTKEAFETIARYSAYLVHRLKSWVNKRSKGQYDFYVWEHQKRGALHLHYAVYVNDYETGESIIQDFPHEWCRLLKSVGALSGVDLFDTGKGYSHEESTVIGCQYAQRVRLDVSRYLSKYVSKQGKGDTVDANTALYCPSRWYGVSRPLLAKLRELTITRIFHIASLREVHKRCEEIYGYLANLANVCHAYKCKYTGLQICVAYQSHWSLDTLCLRLNLMNNQSKKESTKSVKCSEWTSLYLLSKMKQYSMTPHRLSKNSSVIAVLAAEKLYQSVLPSISEAMEITHAIRWTLWYQFRDRYQPASYQKDMETLDELYSKLLTLKLRANKRGDEPLTDLDEYTVDKKMA